MSAYTNRVELGIDQVLFGAQPGVQYVILTVITIY